MLADLDRRGGVSVPFLDEATRVLLCAAAEGLPFSQQPDVYGTARVQQRVRACEAFPPDSPFHAARKAMQEFLNAQFAQIEPFPFATPLALNRMVLLRYETGPLGVNPHRDESSKVNLVAILTLCGDCRCCLCADREGNDPFPLDARPGNLVLLRAPGYRGTTAEDRPYHFVADIVGPRLSLVLHQRR